MPQRFHEKTLALLPDRLKVSAERLAQLAMREVEIGRSIPTSVKEWYSLEDAEHVLQRHYFGDNENQVCPLHRLDSPVASPIFEEALDFVQHGMLCFAEEGPLGGCRAVMLDAEDPAVVLVSPNVDLMNPFRRGQILKPRTPGDSRINVQPSAEQFSTFVFCHIWSSQGSAEPRWEFWWGGCEQPATNELEQALRQQFIQLPTTYGEFCGTTMRFQLKNVRLTIYSIDSMNTKCSQWTLQALDEASIHAAIHELTPYRAKFPVRFEPDRWHMV